MAADGGDDCLSTLVTGLLLFLVYSLTVMTLPVTGWWTVRRLDRWQRMVVFRLGKVLPTRGPGWTLVLPGLDRHQLVDLRNKSILVPPQQLITCDGAVVELGAELLYRVCDAHTFVGSCVDPQGALRSLTRTQMVNTLVGQELTTITRRGPEVEEAVLSTINGQIKDWGMEASSLKFSEVKVHKEAEHLSAVNPLLRQLGGMFGGSGSPLVAAPLAADPETSEALRAAVARLPAGPGATSLARGTYRIETTDPAGLYHVLVGDGQ
ncbi:stomatin-like protein 1 [Pollicipes pollicipes]|uniref:stomatin-like protein 1 n=1 Tax=Pollicipes pollicipes TaxID=41117 RepID=UPI001885541A|nr:stomatin-like protein 1 [Pollicipes pollicipes]